MFVKKDRCRNKEEPLGSLACWLSLINQQLFFVHLLFHLDSLSAVIRECSCQRAVRPFTLSAVLLQLIFALKRGGDVLNTLMY